MSSTGLKDLDNKVSSVPNVESGPIDEEKLREIVNESVDYYLGKVVILQLLRGGQVYELKCSIYNFSL